MPTASVVETPARFGAVRQSDEHRDWEGQLVSALASVAFLDVSSALGRGGTRLTVALINCSADCPLEVALGLDGRTTVPATADVREIGVGSLDRFAVNRIGVSEVVRLSSACRIELQDHHPLTLAAHSVTLLTVDLA